MQSPRLLKTLFLVATVCYGCQRDSSLFAPTGAQALDASGAQDSTNKNDPNAGASNGRRLVGALPLRANDWNNRGKPLPYPWTNDGSGALTFSFPDERGLIGYAYYRTGDGRIIDSPITADISITTQSGTPAFHWDLTQPSNCDVPPFVVMFVWANRLSWDGEFDRWWAFADKVTLAPGELTVRATPDPARWLSVYGVTGDKNPGAFAAAFQNVSGVGVTLGGGCFYGHGVYTTGGTARMAIRSLRIG